MRPVRPPWWLCIMPKSRLASGESDYAIAAGVSLNKKPWKYIPFSKTRMLSSDGQCKTFDKDRR
ncbi:MAG: hypothetical protein DRR08_12880 [Candidatus Parabeggiatoa sp. nov. 2]|nr:MAG: hypothetical protein B6247_02375 [Beggiatoa sp. 4572_84]RKZ59833.1 MAG: hypothetical protein DRR08_12880 [Gammaproteobacteria bacterium]